MWLLVTGFKYMEKVLRVAKVLCGRFRRASELLNMALVDFFSSSVSRYEFRTFLGYSTHSTQIQMRYSRLLVFEWPAKQLGIVY